MGTQLLAPLNTVHVKYRGFFKDDYKSCCSKPLREVALCCTACLSSSLPACPPLYLQ